MLGINQYDTAASSTTNRCTLQRRSEGVVMREFVSKQRHCVTGGLWADYTESQLGMGVGRERFLPQA